MPFESFGAKLFVGKATSAHAPVRKKPNLFIDRKIPDSAIVRLQGLPVDAFSGVNVK
jgi:hypothetical protein